MSDAKIVIQPISSTVIAPGKISATVSPVITSAASISGGVGATGPAGEQGAQGPPGPSITHIDQLADVEATNPAQGDRLRYIDGAWRDAPSAINGGNF